MKNKNLFNSFIDDYNISQNRSDNITPLDTICFYKGTNKPAFNFNAYGDFYNTNASDRFGYLYSNKEGIWALFQDNDGPTMSIFHLTDTKGNLLGTQENGLDTVKLNLQSDFKPFFVYDNSLTWLDVSQKKIYHYENEYLTLLVDNSKYNHKYSYEEVKKIADEFESKKKKNAAKTNSSSTESKESAAQNFDNSMIQEITARLQNNQETIEALLSNQEKQLKSQNENSYKNYLEDLISDISSLQIELNSVTKENSDLQKQLDSLLNEKLNLQTELDSITANFKKNEKEKNLFLILFIVFILVSVILSIILITNYTNQTRKLNEIKNNKKFIYDIQEAERAKISRDIHDSVIQDIRSIRIDTELINATNETEVRKEKVINTATQCVVKLRNICYNLTPAELMTHEQGDSSKIELISIIQSLVLQFIEKTHVPCQLKIDENFEYPVFSKEISQNLFRIIQEAFNNIEKHSYATNCQIFIKNKMENNKKYMLIYISDDGIGCDIEQILKKHKKDHFGIQNMIDRAELIGASISFQSEQGQGMEIRIQI